MLKTSVPHLTPAPSGLVHVSPIDKYTVDGPRKGAARLSDIWLRKTHGKAHKVIVHQRATKKWHHYADHPICLWSPLLNILLIVINISVYSEEMDIHPHLKMYI